MSDEKIFYVNKDEIHRLKTFSAFIKKLEAISPLDQTQLFVVKSNKLIIYGYGNGTLGSGHIQSTFDLVADENHTNDDFYFSCSLNNFIKFLEKTKSEIIQITFKNNSELVIKGNQSKSVFSQVVLVTQESEVEEIENAVSNYETSEKYTEAKEIKLADSKNQILTASSILSLLNTNKFLEISEGNIRVVDDCSIIDLKTDIQDNISIVKNAAQLLSDDIGNTIRYYETSEKETWIYADAAAYGIKFFFAQEPVQFQCPTDEELKDISPNENYIKVSISSKDLFEAFSEFKDVFSNESWQYKQISMVTKVDENKFSLHFDDMVTSIDSELPFKIIENTETEKEFQMMLPFIQLNLLEDIIKENETLVLKYSADPEISAVNISCEDEKKATFNNIIITKLLS